MRIRSVRFVTQILFFAVFVAAFRGLIKNAVVLNALNGTSLLAALSRLSWMSWSPVLFVTLVVVLASLIFGRVYCSFFCPVGFIQDLGRRVSEGVRWKRLRPEGKPFSWSRTFFLFLVLGALASHSSIYQYLDHCSLFGKIVLLTPAGLVAVVALFGMSLKVSRWFCTAACPAGTLFSLIHRGAALRIEKPLKGADSTCGGCTLCQQKCISDAIGADGSIDRGRCIQCLECLQVCPKSQIRLERRWFRRHAPEPRETARVEFLKVAGIAAAGFFLSRPLAAKVGGLLAPKTERIVPPGAGGTDLFFSRCVGCGLCVSSCPSHVIKMSGGYPLMDYSKWFCSYECNACLGVCPNGALANYPLETKKRIRIGLASLDRTLCVAHHEKKSCGACAEHCPTGAITGQAETPALLVPVLDESKCIGCGACQQICPTEPRKAVVVNPVKVQTFAAEPGIKSSAPTAAPGGQQTEEDFRF